MQAQLLLSLTQKLVMSHINFMRCLAMIFQQSGAPETIELRDTWFTPYPEECTSEIPRYEPIYRSKIRE